MADATGRMFQVVNGLVDVNYENAQYRRCFVRVKTWKPILLVALEIGL